MTKTIGNLWPYDHRLLVSLSEQTMARIEATVPTAAVCRTAGRSRPLDEIVREGARALLIVNTR
ncbi:hypothetical protein [Nocardia sp. NPDC049526]|uniref:hypothetical protein n=1 Tax=Nocardia sp. NPDC049526 TaxID=3364316 RepID=UPI0037ACF267